MIDNDTLPALGTKYSITTDVSNGFGYAYILTLSLASAPAILEEETILPILALKFAPFFAVNPGNNFTDFPAS